MRAALVACGAAMAMAADDMATFRRWQQRFEIEYSEGEESHRFGVWRRAHQKYGEAVEQHLYADRLEEELQTPDLLGGSIPYPYKDLPDSYVQKALKSSVDWRKDSSKCVTTPKNQGSHGYCGTFMRVAVAESQWALAGNQPRNLSTEQLVDCVGWASDQFPMMHDPGLETYEDYAYVPGKYTNGTPPCTMNTSKIVAKGWTNFTHGGSTEDQLAAFMYKNGPVGTGINADVFYHVGSDNFVEMDGCNTVSKGHNHAVTIVGFGKDSTHGDYWIIKNSWGSGWRDNGFVYMPRGVMCGGCCAGAQMFFMGDPATYFEV